MWRLWTVSSAAELTVSLRLSASTVCGSLMTCTGHKITADHCAFQPNGYSNRILVGHRFLAQFAKVYSDMYQYDLIRTIELLSAEQMEQISDRPTWELVGRIGHSFSKPCYFCPPCVLYVFVGCFYAELCRYYYTTIVIVLMNVSGSL